MSRSRGNLDPKRVSSELFTLTYGCMVAQLLKDFDSPDEVNTQLEKMGYNIGVRLIEDFLAHNPSSKRCLQLEEVADVLTKQGFRMFLGTVPEIRNWSAAKDEFSLILTENPLSEFVELPPNCANSLWYSNIICGVVKGALEMVQLEVKCWFVQDCLRGADTTEIRVKFVKILEDSLPAGED